MGMKIVVNTISNKLSNVVSVKGSVGVAGDYEFSSRRSFIRFTSKS